MRAACPLPVLLTEQQLPRRRSVLKLQPDGNISEIFSTPEGSVSAERRALGKHYKQNKPCCRDIGNNFWVPEIASLPLCFSFHISYSTETSIDRNVKYANVMQQLHQLYETPFKYLPPISQAPPQLTPHLLPSIRLFPVVSGGNGLVSFRLNAIRQPLKAPPANPRTYTFSVL